MSVIINWLKIGAIGLPLLGALPIKCVGDRHPHIRPWLSAIIFSLVGLMALALFVINRHYGCILTFGRQNCLFDGLATLSLFFLSLLFARQSVVAHPLHLSSNVGDEVLRLLLVGAWAGMGLIENLLVFLIAFNLFLYVIHRWLKRRGLTWGFLVFRDDYKDDYSPK